MVVGRGARQPGSATSGLAGLLVRAGNQLATGSRARAVQVFRCTLRLPQAKPVGAGARRPTLPENMSPGQRGAVTGGALGTGIGMVAGGSFGQVVGAGLISGAVGYVGGSAMGNR